MQDDPVTFSVVVPVYNSAAVLAELHQRLSSAMQALGEPYELVFVEDCGTDNSWHVLEGLVAADPHVIALQLTRNSGQACATLCGLAQARGALVVTMDDDLQHPPEEVPALLRALGHDADVVMGVPRRKQHNLFRRLGSRAMHSLNAWLLGNDRDLRFSSFRLMRREVVDGLLGMQTPLPALNPMINSITRRIVNTRFAHAPRRNGRSNYDLRRLVSHALNNLVGYSMLPLRLLALVGAVGIVASLCFAAILVARYLVGGITVPGWTTIALMLLLLSGFNFFAFAILGEYVLRILQRANATPRYLVRSRAGGAERTPMSSSQANSAGAPAAPPDRSASGSSP